MKKILMIDDEQMVLDAVETILEEMSFDVTTCSNAPDGLEIALSEDFDLILMDIRMPSMTGAELTERVLDAKPDTKILILTGYPGDPFARRAMEAGAVGLVRKPFEIAKILSYLED
jgi:YesN/AraC family two-component response regulator